MTYKLLVGQAFYVSVSDSTVNEGSSSLSVVWFSWWVLELGRQCGSVSRSWSRDGGVVQVVGPGAGTVVWFSGWVLELGRRCGSGGGSWSGDGGVVQVVGPGAGTAVWFS